MRTQRTKEQRMADMALLGIDYTCRGSRIATTALLFRRDITASRAWLESRTIHMDLDLVDLAVVFRRRVAEQVLPVQFVRDARKGAIQILSEFDLGVTSAGLLGN